MRLAAKEASSEEDREGKASKEADDTEDKDDDDGEEENEEALEEAALGSVRGAKNVGLTECSWGPRVNPGCVTLLLLWFPW